MKNVLYIHSDQHRFDCIGSNDTTRAQTPFLDKLAEQGVNFSQAYTPIPICSPARASLSTGAWPTTHGCVSIPRTEIFRPVRDELPILSNLVSESGRKVGYVGKYHDELNGSLQDYGVDEFVPHQNYSAWREQQGIPALPVTRGYFGEVDAACPSDSSSLAWQADNVIRMIEDWSADGESFFMRWDPPEPHLPCTPTLEFANRYDPKKIEPWISWPDSLEGKPDVLQRQRRLWGIEDWTWEDWQPFVARYLAIISEMDFHIGRVLAKVEELGLNDNTTIIYSSDHGDFSGGHGLIDKHYSMYDDIVRVPLVMRCPELSGAGRTCGSFVSNELDVAKTILGLFDIEAPDTFSGINLLDLVRGDVAERKSIFSQYFGVFHGTCSQRMVRDHDFKYVYSPTLFDELYDLREDPGEKTNLIKDEDYKDDLERMRSLMIEWMKSIDDPLFNIWSEVELTNSPGLYHRLDCPII